MTGDAKDSLDSDWLELSADPDPVAGAGDEQGPPPAEPVVVIQYRNRGLPAVVLFPLTLLASLGLFVGYHHFFVEPLTSRAEALARPKPPRPPTIVVNLDETLAKVSAAMPVEAPSFPSPLTLESQPLPSGFDLPTIHAPAHEAAVRAEPGVDAKPIATPAAPSEPAAAPDLKAEVETPVAAAEPEGPAPLSIAAAAPDWARSFPLKPGPPPADPGPEPVADPGPVADAPPPTREELMERIRQEGLLKQAREEEMERRKRKAVEEVEADALQRVENERVEFRRELQSIVASGADDAGEAIDDLCNRFGRGYTEELKNRAYGSLAHYKGKLTRDGEVQMLRAIGVPEAGILDYLANRMHRSMNSRNGPRDPGEVRLFAARQLLRIKLDAPPADRKPASVRRTTNVRRP